MRAAWLILLLSLAASFSGWRHAERQAAEHEETRLAAAADHIREDIARRLAIYELALHAGAGLMASADAVGPEEWRRFAERMELERRYPGIKALGFARRLDAGAPHALDARAVRTGVAFIEPLTPLNRKALGYDMYAEPVRREAMLRACTTGATAMTGRLALFTDGKTGFLLYKAVHHGLDDTGDNGRLLGWVYASFRAADFFPAALNGAAAGIDVEVFDGATLTAEHLLFDTNTRLDAGDAAAGRWHRSDSLDFAGRHWTLNFAATPAAPGVESLWLPASGGLAGLLLFALVAGSSRARRQALEHAESSRGHLATIARQNEELQALERLKADFLAAVTHELKTPLNAIIGFADLLVAGIPKPLDPEARAHAEDILAAGQEMLTKVQQLVLHARIEAGQVTPAPLAVDLPRVLLAAVDARAAAAAAKGLALRFQPPGDVPPLETDAPLLRVILDALLDNAIKFTEAGAIDLRARRAGQGAQAWLEISVADSGIGIAAERQADLFQPFRQIDGGLARAHGGAGLGLSLARRLARLLGGDISVASEPGRGSIFTLRLPWRIANPE